MKQFAILVIVLVVAATNGFAQKKVLVNVNEEGVILEGYDPIPFFQYKAVKGSSEFQSEYGGAIYYFSSEENKAQFDAHPDKYAPMFGGYCAVAAALNKISPIEIWTHQIVNGKLIFNHNQKAFDLWAKDIQGNWTKAMENWPGLVKKNGK
jgi:YHS domain-containing protein